MTWWALASSVLASLVVGAVYGYRRGYDAGHRRGWIAGMARCLNLWAEEDRRTKPARVPAFEHPAVAQHLTQWNPDNKH